MEHGYSGRLKFAFTWWVLVLGLAIKAHAAVVVTSLENSGPGSLREALDAAPAGAEITFAVEGAILVRNSSLVLSKNVQIDGPGADKLALTGFSPVFEISNSVKASLSGVRITNAFRAEFGPEGVGGGAVRNYGDLTMTRCVISECGSQFGFGGGILSCEKLTLRQCSISNNITEFGGGVADVGKGQMVIDRCTINNNRALHRGNFEGLGGGIVKLSGILWMSNSTLSGNCVYTGDGGGLSTGGAYAFINNCTIVSNIACSPFGSEFGRGGGLFKSNGTVEIRNTILAGNSASTRDFLGEGPDCFGWLFSRGWNLIQSPSNCVVCGVLTGNIIGADPRLGSLVDNGGPTLTHALLQNSPAIDAGSPGISPSIDQRGVSRPQNGKGKALGDIGAFEKETPARAVMLKFP